ncbi:MAG TPA: hypothetical protein VKU91_02690, partial [Acidimicrobiales bacterium]|nr:hypothetical protein [Acidimicrobiales bacterium]
MLAPQRAVVVLSPAERGGARRCGANGGHSRPPAPTAYSRSAGADRRRRPPTAAPPPPPAGGDAARLQPPRRR